MWAHGLGNRTHTVTQKGQYPTRPNILRAPGKWRRTITSSINCFAAFVISWLLSSAMASRSAEVRFLGCPMSGINSAKKIFFSSSNTSGGGASGGWGDGLRFSPSSFDTSPWLSPPVVAATTTRIRASFFRKGRRLNGRNQDGENDSLQVVVEASNKRDNAEEDLMVACLVLCIDALSPPNNLIYHRPVVTSWQLLSEISDWIKSRMMLVVTSPHVRILRPLQTEETELAIIWDEVRNRAWQVVTSSSSSSSSRKLQHRSLFFRSTSCVSVSSLRSSTTVVAKREWLWRQKDIESYENPEISVRKNGRKAFPSAKIHVV